MSLSTKYAALLTSMQNFATILNTKLQEAVPFVLRANNTQKLDGKTHAEFIDDVEEVLQEHLDDPAAHGDTADSFNTYTKAYVDGLMGSKIKQGILPISRAKVNDDCIIELNEISGQWEMMTVDLIVVMSGLVWKYNGQKKHVLVMNSPVELPDFETITPGTDIYFYAELFAGMLYFSVSTTPKPETNSVMWVGTRNVDDILVASAFSSEMNVGGIFRIDAVRVSDISRGTAIPVSGENPTLLWT